MMGEKRNCFDSFFVMTAGMLCRHARLSSPGAITSGCRSLAMALQRLSYRTQTGLPICKPYVKSGW